MRPLSIGWDETRTGSLTALGTLRSVPLGRFVRRGRRFGCGQLGLLQSAACRLRSGGRLFFACSCRGAHRQIGLVGGDFRRLQGPARSLLGPQRERPAFSAGSRLCGRDLALGIAHGVSGPARRPPKFLRQARGRVASGSLRMLQGTVDRRCRASRGLRGFPAGPAFAADGRWRGRCGARVWGTARRLRRACGQQQRRTCPGVERRQIRPIRSSTRTTSTTSPRPPLGP